MGRGEVTLNSRAYGGGIQVQNMKFFLNVYDDNIIRDGHWIVGNIFVSQKYGEQKLLKDITRTPKVE